MALLQNSFAQPTLWRHLVGETRTRILLLYALAMLASVAVAVPIYRALLFSQIDGRVRADLREELEEFNQSYAAWDATQAETDTTLEDFVADFLRNQVPQDDNFHLFFLNGQFLGSNPKALPPLLQPDSDLGQQWATLTEDTRSYVLSSDPQVGRVLYKTRVLEMNDVPLGVFVIAHLTAGERQEALAGVWLFGKVSLGVVAVAFLLAWVGSHQLLEPMQQLATTARNINPNDLSHRLAVPGSGELADMALTFNAMMDRMESAFDSQRDFINDASHELLTPLTIVQGHLELMGSDPEEQAETLDLVMDELDRMGRFINDLLLLAKAEQPDFLQLEPVDLQEFTRAVFDKASVLADRQWRLGPVGRGLLMADRQQLTGAILNLAQNAAHHTRPTDIIGLGSSMTQRNVNLWVRDTGYGIAPADQVRIFERFARASGERPRSEGAGLGLAIVKTMVERHGGTIELVSQVGVGSTFTLVLPKTFSE